MDGFLVHDAAGRIFEVNRAYAEMTGFSEPELLAMSVSDLEIGESPDLLLAHMDSVSQRGRDRFETRHRAKDGRILDVEISADFDPDSQRFAVFIRDITSRVTRARYVALERTVLGILNRSAELQPSLQDVAEAIQTYSEFDAVGIRLHVEDDFPYVAHVGLDPDHLAAEESLVWRDGAGRACFDSHGNVVLECTCGWVLSGGRHPYLTDGGSYWTDAAQGRLADAPDGDPRIRPRNLCLIEGYNSVALVPIHAKEQAIGLIHVNDRRSGVLTAEIVERLESLALFIGEAFLRKSAEMRLERAFESTVALVGHVSETRDPYTAGHQRRVSQLATALAERMGLTAEQIADVRIAGLMHDVGKIGIPAEILSKPGALLPVEFEIIKAHAQAGYEIVASAGLPGDVAKIILQHHERCDGSGYPSQLVSADLLPSSKVLMVADVVEAMSSHRPYRPTLGLEAAMEEIRLGAGVLYDADVVAECVDLMKSGFEFTD